MRQLFYGDNLKVMRTDLQGTKVDLIYLDPPFNSQAAYNIIFPNKSAGRAAQSMAFADTWHWGSPVEDALNDLTHSHGRLAQFLTDITTWLNRDSLSAYLVMMAVRLVEMHGLLKPSGSIYLHCDTSASHYLKMIMDVIFGQTNFRSEIIWKGADAHNDAKKQYAGITDRILFYSKDFRHTYFAPQHLPFPQKTLKEWYLTLQLADGSVRRMTPTEIETQTIPKGSRRFNAGDMSSPSPRPNLMFAYKGFPHPPKGWRYSMAAMEELDSKGLLLFPKEPTGRIMRKRYLDEAKGPVLPDLWTDIPQIRGHDVERLGYPTQKPTALLERIVSVSCPPEGIVLDPFCGCGTAIAASEKLKRSWIGIDITHLSIGLIKTRLQQDFQLTVDKDYDEIGAPTDLEGAHNLAHDKPFQFQFWIVDKIGAQSYGAIGDSKIGKKGGDTGIDGQYFFRTPDGHKVEQAIVSVKAGKNLNPSMVRDLIGTVQREKAALGIFLCAHEPTKGMLEEAAKAGSYLWGGKSYPKIQILSASALMAGSRPILPQGVTNVSMLQKPAKTIQTTTRAKKEQPLFEVSAD